MDLAVRKLLLEKKPALLQFIDDMNLLDPLLHFSHIFAVN